MARLTDRQDLAKEVQKLVTLKLPPNTGYVALKDAVLREKFPLFYGALEELAECFQVPLKRVKCSIGLVTSADSNYKTVSRIATPCILQKSGVAVIRWGEVTVPIQGLIADKMVYGKDFYIDKDGGGFSLLAASWSQEREIIPFLSLPLRVQDKGYEVKALIAAFNAGNLADFLHEMNVDYEKMALLDESATYTIDKVGAKSGVSGKTKKSYWVPWFQVKEFPGRAFLATGKPLKSAIALALGDKLDYKTVEWYLETYTKYAFQGRQYINYSLDLSSSTDVESDIGELFDVEDTDSDLFN